VSTIVGSTERPRSASRRCYRHWIGTQRRHRRKTLSSTRSPPKRGGIFVIGAAGGYPARNRVDRVSVHLLHVFAMEQPYCGRSTQTLKFGHDVRCFGRISERYGGQAEQCIKHFRGVCSRRKYADIAVNDRRSECNR
jgi:hypothetical protein